MPYTGIPITQKGAPNGVATLNGSGQVPTAQLPAPSGGDAILLGSYGQYVNQAIDAYDAIMVPISVTLPPLAKGSAIFMTMASSVWTMEMFIEVYDNYAFPLHFNEQNEHTSRTIWTQMDQSDWMMHAEGTGQGELQQYVGWMSSIELELWFISNADVAGYWEGMYGINLFAIKG